MAIDVGMVVLIAGVVVAFRALRRGEMTIDGVAPILGGGLLVILGLAIVLAAVVSGGESWVLSRL
jgi:hypothetical protein